MQFAGAVLQERTLARSLHKTPAKVAVVQLERIAVRLTGALYDVGSSRWQCLMEESYGSGTRDKMLAIESFDTPALGSGADAVVGSPQGTYVKDSSMRPSRPDSLRS